MPIEQGDKVFLGEQRTPYRAATMGHLHGEKAVGLCRSGDTGLLNDWIKYQELDSYGPVTSHVPIARWIPLADLVKDPDRRGWRERWRQLSLPLEGEANAQV
jgi:hypothetical protein